MAGGAKSAYQAGAAASGADGVRAAGAGLANVARSGAGAVGQRVASSAKAAKDAVVSFIADAAAPTATKVADASESSTPASEPAWAKQMRRKQKITHAATTAAHALRSGDTGGSGASPSLRDDSNS